MTEHVLHGGGFQREINAIRTSLWCVADPGADLVMFYLLQSFYYKLKIVALQLICNISPFETDIKKKTHC